MKATNTTSIEVPKKVLEIDTHDLLKISTITCLVCIVSILLYNNLYLLSLGIVIVSFAAVRTYRFYKELTDADWSIDISNFTIEDAVADLESKS